MTIVEQAGTRRSILNIVSSIYDPMGMISPLIMTAKLIIQAMARNNISWDKSLPNKLLSMWKKWKMDMAKVVTLAVDCCIRPAQCGHVNA